MLRKTPAAMNFRDDDGVGGGGTISGGSFPFAPTRQCGCKEGGKMRPFGFNIWLVWLRRKQIDRVARDDLYARCRWCGPTFWK